MSDETSRRSCVRWFAPMLRVHFRKKPTRMAQCPTATSGAIDGQDLRWGWSSPLEVIIEKGNHVPHVSTWQHVMVPQHLFHPSRAPLASMTPPVWRMPWFSWWRHRGLKLAEMHESMEQGLVQWASKIRFKFNNQTRYFGNTYGIPSTYVCAHLPIFFCDHILGHVFH